MASSPEILYPITNWTSVNNKYLSEATTQIIQGNVPAVISEVLDGTTIITVEHRYSILRDNVIIPFTSFSTIGVTIGSTDINVDVVPWSFNTVNVIDLQEGDLVTIEFKTVERKRIGNGIASYTISESSVSTVVIEIIPEGSIQGTVEIPTGVSLKRSQDSIKVLVPSDAIILGDNSEFVGVNFYLALVAGGGTSGYNLVNNSYINTVDYSETKEEIVSVNNYENIIEDLTVTTTESRQVSTTYFTFTINPTVLSGMVQQGKIDNIFLSDGVSLDPKNSYYLVTTVVIYDNDLSQVVESNFSVELEGKFIEYRVDYSGLPDRTQNDVITSINRRLISNNQKVNVISGSVIRDILDPVSFEFEKSYIIQDFIFKALSIDSLIAFDDSDGDGISDPLQTNLGKFKLAEALGYSSATNFQVFINEQFDKFASNYNLERKGAVRSRGSVVFYTSGSFNNDILIPSGTVLTAPSDPDTGRAAVNFYVVGTYILESDNKDYYYNSRLKRYEIEASIEASYPGVLGNVPAGTITISSGLNPQLEVENTSPTNYGEDRESNRDLSNRIKLGYVSYDSGTEGGYSATALSVPGVSEVRVEKVGDPLMMRDYDDESKKHIGGKVDIYVKGYRKAQVVDQVSFKYEYPSDVTGANVSERFDVTNAVDFRIRSRNSALSASSPIVFVSEVRNVTRGKNYDLTSMSIVGEGDTIILEGNLLNNSIGMASFDVINVSYKYRSSNLIKLSNQPVDGIVSVVDSQNTAIDSTLYRLVKRDDPLKSGYSNISSDSIEFLFESSNDFNEFMSISDEQHNLFFNIGTTLNNKGVEISTIVVYNPDDNSIIYKKDVDYIVTSGSQTEGTSISLKSGSMIRQGDVVSIDYTAAQNFFVTYTYNSLLSEVMNKVLDRRHACSDVSVKNAVGNFIDLSFRVVRNPGVNIARLKSRIQTAVANRIINLKMGESFTQSTLISVVKAVDGVKDFIMPMTKMMKRNGSFIQSDNFGTIAFEVYNRTNSYGIVSYRSINSVLSFKTQDNGGPDNLFRAVYEDNAALQLVGDVSEVHKASGQAYIQADGRIVVSTVDGRPPHTKNYKAAYYVYYGNNENIVEDITTGQTEYIRIDSLSLSSIEVIDPIVVKRGL